MRILISDLWDERIFYTYNRVVFGAAEIELKGLNNSLVEKTSPHHIGNFMKKYLPPRSFADVSGRLTIKRLPILTDTFWFIDADNTYQTGNMLFMLMIAATGRDRPVYYVNQADNPTLFSKYFDMCRGAYDLSADQIWPA